jgi:hypothetical protein
MKKNYSLLVISACLLAKGLMAQCGLSLSTSESFVCAGDNVTLVATATPPVTVGTLTTTLAGGNNHRGNMFDITATNAVTITSFDAHPMANTTVEIYYRTSPYAGFEASSAGWIFVGSAAVTAQPFGTATPIPVAVNVVIPAGQTYSFYVTSTNTAVSLNYTDGSSEGSPFTSDANIIFRQGVGMEYPFTNGGGIFRPRVWNGVIHYTTPNPATYTYLWNTSASTQTINPTINATTQYTVQANVTGCPTMYDTIDITVSTPPVNAGNDIAVCIGNTATLSGTGAVSYAWDNGIFDNVMFMPSVTADYIVTGTDSIGCTANDTVTVTVNNLPNISAGSDLEICAGTPVTLAGSGAVSYSWTNSVTDGVAFTPASTMSYTVTGTDGNGCMNDDTVMITVNGLPAVYAGADQVFCEGAPVLLAGSGADSYAWDNGVTDGVAFTAMSTMTYVVTGIDSNSCMNTDTVTVTVNPLPAVDAGLDITICDGSSVTLGGSGAVTYTWDNGVTNGVPFTPQFTLLYAVTGTDANGCMNSDTVLVIVNHVSNATSTVNETITALETFSTYQWIDCSTFTPITGETGQSFTATANGSYAVIINHNGCIDTSACQTISSVGIETISAVSAVSVYPNPTNGQVVISTGNIVANEMSILDVTGKTIATFRPVNAVSAVDLSAYANGVYFVRVSIEGSAHVVKIVKN